MLLNPPHLILENYNGLGRMQTGARANLSAQHSFVLIHHDLLRGRSKKTQTTCNSGRQDGIRFGASRIRHCSCRELRLEREHAQLIKIFLTDCRYEGAIGEFKSTQGL